MAMPKDNPEEPPGTQPDATTVSSNDAKSRRDIARRFLDDETVKGATRERKVDFLKSKDFTDDEIEALLREESCPDTSIATESFETPAATMAEQQPPDLPSTTKRPPIITYPEFLVEPPKPPPLLSPSTLLTTLSSLAGLATLLHGTNRHALQPMLESQTEARHGYHAAVLESLSNLVSKLEGTVSELPPSFNRRKTQDDEDNQSGEDPSELFHRDIGTQTSPESFLMSSTNTQEPDPFVIQTQTSTLRKITFSLDSLRDNLETHASAVQQTKARVELLKDDVREMDRRARDLKASTNNAGYSLYSGWSSGGGTSGEPDDEIRRAREMLRGMKGAVLSRAMGPTSRPVGR